MSLRMRNVISTRSPPQVDPGPWGTYPWTLTLQRGHWKVDLWRLLSLQAWCWRFGSRWWFQYPLGNDHMSHPGKRKIIDSKVPLGGDMLVSRRVYFLIFTLTWGNDSIWLISLNMGWNHHLYSLEFLGVRGEFCFDWFDLVRVKKKTCDFCLNRF